MPRPYQLDPMASLAAFYGAEQRRYRETARMTQAELATKLNYSEQMIAHIESARRTATPTLVAQADKILDAHGALIELAKLVAALPNWFDRYRELETEATDIHIWDMRAIPGLLQTREYAHAVVKGGRPSDPDEDIDATVSERLQRQAILDGPKPKRLWCIVSEAALRKVVGSADITRRQLQHLLEQTTRSNINIQVLPLSSPETTGSEGPFVILRSSGLPDAVYAEARECGRMMDQEGDVSETICAYDRLRAAALSLETSTGMILSAMENLWEYRSS